MNEQTYPWYMVNKDGMASLCADQADAEQEAKNAQEAWPHIGPHRAVRLVEVGDAGFTASDMATAAAQGFREGQAAAQAAVAAGWMPIETAPKDGTLILIREQRCSGLAVMYLHGWKYESGNICYLEPTHWRPLPPAPSTEGESGNGVAP